MQEHSSRYIHYGSNTFDINKDVSFTVHTDWKPSGLWASPETCMLSWADFCKEAQFHCDRLAKHFTFQLSPEAKILHLHKLDDAKDYLEVAETTRYNTYYKLNSNRLYENFDGVELHISEDYARFHSNNVFNTWDVDSICIWNLNVIQIIQ